ncbi:MAG: CDP-alcohol phosphatidyltransferase family protein [Gammaproteobacteria bacterium]|nr:CDP-alcohol phosphatidyltransferase family protein [Gammaproteobacteria bacterium]
MSIYALKPAFQGLLRPLVKRLATRGITANQVTLLACGVSLLVGVLVCVAVAMDQLLFLWALPLWFFVRMAFNAIDGMLAREHGQQSALGGYLNELTDVVSDSALYLPLALVPGVTPWLVGLVMVLAVISELAGVLGQVHGNGRRYDGPMGKSDRAFAISLTGVLILLVPQWPWLPDLLLGLVNLLLLLTVWRRVGNGLRAGEC